MREVAVRGVGATVFGRHPDETAPSLAEQAVHAALVDAEVAPGELQAAWIGNATSGVLGGQLGALGQVSLRPFGVGGIPVTRVENACASGSTAFREAYLAIATGQADVALALGVEVLTQWPTRDVTRVMVGASEAVAEAPFGITFPGVFGMIARRHMADHGTTAEQLAAVAVKAHENGARNPIAQFSWPISVDDVLAARRVATPLGLLDCCPISDGAAAAVLVAGDLARASDPRVLASALTSGSYLDDASLTRFPLTELAARQCWDRAGLGPADVDLAEVHDCFTIAEIVHCEDLGFCAKGDGGPFAASGATGRDGAVAVNPSGGLKARGHPVGATGLAQVAEAVWQLRGDAGERQVRCARVAVTHTLGGFVHGDAAACAMHVLARN